MAVKRVLITGGTGILGKALMEDCPAGIQVFTTYIRDCWGRDLPCPARKLDITNRKDTLRAISEWARPDVVIHAAGIGNVDFAENNRTVARKIIVGGTANVIAACRRNDVKLIYISSNAVFDGGHPPYAEDSERLPVNYYGRLKVQAEDLVMNSGLKYAIVRAILMYGWHFPYSRSNPVTHWLRLLSEGKPVNVVTDRYSQPLFAEDCAKIIWEIVKKDKGGIYHVSGADRLSLFDFAKKTAEIFGFDKRLIKPVASSYFPELAPRPVDTSFLTAKIKKEMKTRPRGIKEGLQRMKATSLDAHQNDV
ncbi:MAG: NAD(P)-dependent oxidoreductase [Planctomycetota bacterium]